MCTSRKMNACDDEMHFLMIFFYKYTSEIYLLVDSILTDNPNFSNNHLFNSVLSTRSYELCKRNGIKEQVQFSNVALTYSLPILL